MDTLASKECLYCGRTNPASAMQCLGCGAGSFGPIRTNAQVARQPIELVPPIPSSPVKQIEPAVRILYFFFIGFPVGFLWALLSLPFLLIIVAYPLAFAMLRLLPTVVTLHRTNESFGYILEKGWHDTIASYKAAPLWAKITAPIVFVAYIAGFFWYAAR